MPPKGHQSWGTPRELLDAIFQRWGMIFGWDVAARADNSVAGVNFYGPGSTHGEDGLVEPWPLFVDPHVGWWNNPPFKRIGPWSRKARFEAAMGGRGMQLVPMALDSMWFVRDVYKRAAVHPLRPRVAFVGAEQGARTPTMIVRWGPDVEPCIEPWRWKRSDE